jgi:hypothetical protein
VSGRDAFLLRADPAVLDALRRWARDDLRSVNAQIEFLLRRALGSAGRLPGRGSEATRGRLIGTAQNDSCQDAGGRGRTMADIQSRGDGRP